MGVFDTAIGASAVEQSISSIGSPTANGEAVPAVPSLSPTVQQDVNGTAKPASLNLQSLPQLIDIPQTPDAIEKCLKLEAEGEKAFNSHSLDVAMSKWQEAYGMSLEMKYAEGEGRALTNMCRVFLDRGQMVKAKYMGENAIEVLAGVSDHKALGRAHLYLAQAYFGLDNSIWAGQQLDLALKEFNTDGSNNSADTAKLMTVASAVLIKIGKIREALQFLQGAATFYQQAGDPTNSLNSHTRVTDIMLALGLLTAASEEAEKSISLARANPSNPALMVSALSSLANCKYGFGEYAQARKLYEQVYAILKPLGPRAMSVLGRASIDLGYGLSLSAIGEYDAAKTVLERSYNAFTSNGQTVMQAQCANAIGVIEEHLGHRDKAKAQFEQAIDLQNLVQPKQDGLNVMFLQNMAAIEARMGLNNDARARLEIAATVAKRSKDDVALGRTYAAGAEVLLKLANPSSAENMLKGAIEISKNVNDDAALWREYTLLAKMQIETGNAALVKDSLTSALSSFRSPQASEFPSADRITFATGRDDLAEQLVSMLASQKMTEQALLAAEQLKEEHFVNSWFNSVNQVRQEDQDLYGELATQRAHLHAAEITSPPSKLVKEWLAWMQRQKSVAQQNRALARMVAPLPTGITDVVKAVQKTHSTVVEYLMGRESTVIFTINGAGRISATVIPVERRRIESQVVSLLNSIPHDAPNPQASLAEKRVLTALYPSLLPASVRGLLPSDGEQSVLIIPDGILFNVPFGALISEQSKYFIESHSVAFAPSISSLIDSPPRYTDEFNLLVVGSDGKAAADEANYVAQAFSPESVSKIVGKEVDMKSLQDQSHGKSAVNFFDKITFPDFAPLKATLPIDSGDGAGKKATLEKLVCGTFPNDLFVLSATSLAPKDSGIAMRMLSRGLNYAGVRNVMPTLWQQQTSERDGLLMDFYRNRQQGASISESLRKAQLAAIAKDSAPHTWAAFQLIGPGN